LDQTVELFFACTDELFIFRLIKYHGEIMYTDMFAKQTGPETARFKKRQHRKKTIEEEKKRYKSVVRGAYCY